MTPAEKLVLFGVAIAWAGFLVLVLGLARAAARADREVEALFRDTTRPE